MKKMNGLRNTAASVWLLCLLFTPVDAGASGRINVLESGIKGLRIGVHKGQLEKDPELGARLSLSHCYPNPLYPGESNCALVADNFSVAHQKTERISLVFDNDVLTQVTLWLVGDVRKPLSPDVYPHVIGVFSASTGHAPSIRKSSLGREMFSWSDGRNELQVHYSNESNGSYELLINLLNVEAMSKKNRTFETIKSDSSDDI